jgi:amino acid permease
MNAFPKDPFQAVSATATLFFAFNFQFNFFPIYKGMKDVTDRKMQFACFTGLLGCAIPYIIVGYLGFAMVGYGVNANFLESIVYSETNPALYFAINIFYLFSLLFAIILLFFGARNNFINIVNILKKKINKRMVKKMNADSGVVTSQ